MPERSYLQGARNVSAAILLTIGNVSTTLISFSNPGILQKSCKLQSKQTQMASSLTAGVSSFPFYCLCITFGQLFYTENVPSILPSRHVASRVANSSTVFFVWTVVGYRKYIGPVAAITAAQNRFVVFQAVLLDISR